MRVAGSEPLTAPRPALSAVLEDPGRLAGALPGVDDFVRNEDGSFEATIRPALALGEVPFRTVWRRAGEGLSYRVAGRSGEYVLELRADVRLTDGSVAWEVDCAFTGAMRAVGQRTLEAIVRHQVALVLEAAQRQAREGEDG